MPKRGTVGVGDRRLKPREQQFPNPLVNRLLAALPKADYKRIMTRMERVSLEIKQLAYDVDKPIKFVYFPLTAVFSLVTVMEDGDGVEVATIGNEGMIGLPLFLGVDRTSGKAFTQVPGDSLRMTTTAFKQEIRRQGPLTQTLQLYTQALMVQISQGMACNGIHSIRQRCARWLLMTHDRVAAETFPLSQEFLALMLGVRRAGVNEVATELKQAGLIQYSRGVIRILNRKELEDTSCECYHVIRREFDRLLGSPQKQ
jgi:CRP-like cAMP-binding protein